MRVYWDSLLGHLKTWTSRSERSPLWPFAPLSVAKPQQMCASVPNKTPESAAAVVNPRVCVVVVVVCALCFAAQDL